MRLLMFAFVLSLCGCATAVNDSLDRRGVDPGALLTKRIDEARNRASQTEKAFAEAVGALAKIDRLEGAELAHQLDLARAAGQNSSVATQELRLSVNSAKEAAARYFKRRSNELALTKSNTEAAAAMEFTLRIANERHKNFVVAFNAANLRLSPALKLYNSEVAKLRENATSQIAAEARKDERASAINAVDDARDGLAGIVITAEDYREAIK